MESRWNPFQFPLVLPIVVARYSHSFRFQAISSPFLPLVALLLQPLYHRHALLQFVSRNIDTGAAGERRVNRGRQGRMMRFRAFHYPGGVDRSCHSHLIILSYSVCFSSPSDHDIEMHAPMGSVLLTVEFSVLLIYKLSRNCCCRCC